MLSLSLSISGDVDGVFEVGEVGRSESSMAASTAVMVVVMFVKRSEFVAFSVEQSSRAASLKMNSQSIRSCLPASYIWTTPHPRNRQISNCQYD